MISHSSTIPTSIVLLYCILFLSFQITDGDCSSVKNGTFHFYQEKDQYYALILRKDSLQTEIDNKGDTSYWNVAWISDCSFKLSFKSGTKAMSQQELDFYKQSTLKFDITSITKNYYTYDALLSYNNISRVLSDTVWLHTK